MESGGGQSLYYVPYCGKTIPVVVRYEEYEVTSALAVSLYARARDLLETEDELRPEDYSEKFNDLFAVITVNLPDSCLLPRGTQYVDVVNHPWAYQWLADNKIAEPTGEWGRSGFCGYPAMRFGNI